MIKLCLDAGHGGHDPGAVGPTGVEEAATNLDICFRLEALLTAAGLDIKQTRTEDVFVELGLRCSIANSWDADYFVSIHCNSNGPSAVGIETLYTSETGLDLGEPVQDALIIATNDVDRGMKERNDLAVLNGTNMPAILVEVGFISHPATESKLKTANYKHLLAYAIARGLAQYFGIDSLPTPPPKL